MDLQRAGKTVFVSGSTKGISFAIAALCAHEGATVIINGRREEGADAAVARLREQNSVRADVRQPHRLLLRGDR